MHLEFKLDALALGLLDPVAMKNSMTMTKGDTSSISEGSLCSSMFMTNFRGLKNIMM